MIHAVPPMKPVPGAESYRPFLESVYEASVDYGWPHEATMPEMLDVLELVVAVHDPEETGTVSCPWPSRTIARVKCGVLVGGLRYRVDVTVWPGGTFAMRRVTG